MHLHSFQPFRFVKDQVYRVRKESLSPLSFEAEDLQPTCSSPHPQAEICRTAIADQSARKFSCHLQEWFLNQGASYLSALFEQYMPH